MGSLISLMSELQSQKDSLGRDMNELSVLFRTYQRDRIELSIQKHSEATTHFE